MNRVSAALLFFTTIVFIQTGQGKPPSHPREYPATSIREEQSLEVDGVIETWRLQWMTAPKPLCGADKQDASLTCPCMGFAYGESGDLYLIRLRNGEEIDRLRLAPFFGKVFSGVEGNSSAIVQRWPVDQARDYKLSSRDGFPKLVSRRLTVQVMHFADYDHDKKATEFFIQTEAAPCGKSIGVLVGLSATNSRLHVFGTASNPSKPLYLEKFEWEAIRNNSTGSINVVDWPCADHGAETQTELTLKWSINGIDGVRREYECPVNPKRRNLISEHPL
jgi:hypothetical protein